MAHFQNQQGGYLADVSSTLIPAAVPELGAGLGESRKRKGSAATLTFPQNRKIKLSIDGTKSLADCPFRLLPVSDG